MRSRRLLAHVVLPLLAVGALAACASSSDPDATVSASPSQADNAAGGVVGSDLVKPVGGDLREGDIWYLVGAVSETPIPTTVTLAFDGDRASGAAPVNTYSASFTSTKKGGLDLGPIASTRMAGPDDAMAAETAYFGLLERVDGYTTVEGGELYLFDEELQLFTFAASPAPDADLEIPASVSELAGNVVGMSEADATSAVERAGYTVRVLSRDGEDFPATADYRVDRINVRVVDDEVTEATVG